MANLRTTLPPRRWSPVPACAPLLLALALCPLSRIAAQSPQQPATQGPALSDAEAAKQAEAQAAADAAHAQQVQQLLAQAGADYNSGVANYNAGHLDAARTDFDTAVDLMLSSGMDLKNDPQLSDDFDQLLSAINSLEMDALKQGNGFSPKVEEAPLDAADDVTFTANPALVSKVTAELKTTTSDLPLVVN